MSDELWRLDIEHDYPLPNSRAVRRIGTARATIARTVHGLAEHGVVELIEEHSSPDRCSFTMRIDDGARDGLLVVADALTSLDGWTARWVRL